MGYNDKSMGGNYRSNSRNTQSGNYGYDKRRESADSFFSEIAYQNTWIKSEANEALVSYAEKVGKFMADNKLTSSKIRSIYGEIKRIQMGVFEKEKSSFYLLRPKVAYALGRDKNNEGLKLFKLIFDQSSRDVSDQKTYNNFCNFIEAILAYHKAYVKE